MITDPKFKTWQVDWTWRQGPIDALQVQKEGFDVVNLKIGGAIREGWSFVDPFFVRNYTEIVTKSHLQPMGFWYLMPGRGGQQAALCWDQLGQVGAPEGAVIELDIEQDGLNPITVLDFIETWNILSDSYPLVIYTRKNFWNPKIGINGADFTPYLQIARYVPKDIQVDPNKKYASLQYKSVPEEWWHDTFGAWGEISSIQFTPHALVNNKFTSASCWRMSRDDIRKHLVRF